MMSIYPTLYLFSYDLRDGLRQGESTIQENRDAFKRKLSQLPEELLQQIDELDTTGEVVELLKDRIHKFYEATHTGFYYPVRLRDSYGLLIDYSGREAQSLENFQWIEELKNGIYQKLAGETASLGQTWVLYASVPNVPLGDYQTIAQKCYQTWLPRGNWDEDKMGASDFSGGQLFELEQESETGEITHFIIILFSSEKTREDNAPLFIENELRRCLYRNKITRAYLQSQQVKQVLKINTVKIGNLLDDLSELPEKNQRDKNAHILGKANTIFRNYFKSLNDLSVQMPTIETNLLNYRKWTSQLTQSLSGLNFPNEFERRTTEKYLPQIQRDQATFGLQLELIKNVVASVQAQETHHNVEHIAAVQKKVEWLEVFFVSFYAAEFTYIVIELLHQESHFLKNFSAILVAAIFAGIAAFLGLNLKEHLRFDKRFKMVLGIVLMGLLIIGSLLS